MKKILLKSLIWQPYPKGQVGQSMHHKGRLHYVMLLDNMPHENVHLSHNMHATDLVYISKYSHCHCESLDM